MAGRFECQNEIVLQSPATRLAGNHAPLADDHRRSVHVRHSRFDRTVHVSSRFRRARLRERKRTVEQAARLVRGRMASIVSDERTVNASLCRLWLRPGLDSTKAHVLRSQAANQSLVFGFRSVKCIRSASAQLLHHDSLQLAHVCSTPTAQCDRYSRIKLRFI